jgi:hypothetical protein
MGASVLRRLTAGAPKGKHTVDAGPNQGYVEPMSKLTRLPLTRLPLVRTVVLGIVSLALLLASLDIDQVADSSSAARHLGFGYPVHFVYANFMNSYANAGYPQTFNLNPWEVPVDLKPGAFLISWLLTYGVLFAASLLIGRGLRHMFPSVRRIRQL